MTKFCLPIIKNTINEVRETIKKYPDYDMYEVWVDYLTDNLSVILACPESLCFRRKNGEPIHMTFEKRKSIIDNSIGKNILIDCDIDQQKEDLEYIRKIDQKFILSYHNYKETPENEELNKLITTMEQYNPYIYKIATFCQNSDDCVRLMQLLVQLKIQNKKAVVLGMGEYGKITRIFGAMYGNEINFTPENEQEQSAEGQLTKKEIKNIIDNLRGEE